MVQRMTPQGGMDPQQQKMMNLMMPVMLGVISWNLSAGLCLYWVVGNVVAMIMQMALNRTDLGREQKELAAKRARNKRRQVIFPTEHLKPLARAAFLRGTLKPIQHSKAPT